MVCDNELYINDVHSVSDLIGNSFDGKSFLISGASGLIGSFLVDVLMTKGAKILAVSRNTASAEKRFKHYFNSERFNFLEHDINRALDFSERYDYVIHLASNTHPLAYSSDPVGTITANIIGLNNMLSFAVKNKAERFLFASSVEIYGVNRGDTEYFSEDYCGNIDISKARSGYCEAKRCGETLCQSYIQQFGLDIVIPRLSRTYGSTMKLDDSKAISQFIKNTLRHQDIVLKSGGSQLYSYCYVADAVSALLKILADGENGQAYNIADEKSDATLRELAAILADYSGKKIVFEIPEEHEKKGYSAATKAILNSSKLKALGWSPKYDIKSGLKRTLDIMSTCL